MSAADCIAEVEQALCPAVEYETLSGYVAGVSIAGEREVISAGTLAHESAVAMTSSTVFRIASLSKLLGPVLALILAREGTIELDAEVSRWLPELAAPRVLTDMAGALDDTVAAQRPILVHDLLTLTPGLGLVLAPGPLRAALTEQGLAPGPFPPPFSGDEFVARLGRLPLALQPGTGWLYHTGVDVLSVLLARAGGRPLDELLRELVTQPLGMGDTGFWAAEAGRLATAYRLGSDGLEVLDPPEGRFARRPRCFALGSGLVSTVPDFLVFMEMLASGGGELLTADEVTLMGTDRLTDHQRASAQLFLGPGRSWGLGCEVNLDSDETALAPGGFGWMGGTGTTAYVDPARGLAGVLFTQRAMETNRPPPAFVDFWAAVYRGL